MLTNQPQSVAQAAPSNQIVTLTSINMVKTHIDCLIEIEPRFAPIYKQLGLPDLRRNEGGFARLMRAMVGQQLSVAAASSIWNKLEQAGLTQPQNILNADDEDLREQGLSKQKIRYVRSLAMHNIDFEALNTMSDGEVIKTLTAVIGIGKWTAEMYLLFSLGRADVLAVDDLAIKVAAMDLLGLESRPSPKQLRALTESWSPYRSTASLLLWEHYGWLKDRDAVPV